MLATTRLTGRARRQRRRESSAAIVKQIADAKAQYRSLAEAVGRHRRQHRALDAGGIGRPRRRGARSNPHPHRRRPESRQGPRAADGAPPALTRRSRKRPPDAARRALRCRNWHTATMSAYRLSAARHGAHDRHSADNRVLWPTPYPPPCTCSTRRLPG
jgi:hypothetical protein